MRASQSIRSTGTLAALFLPDLNIRVSSDCKTVPCRSGYCTVKLLSIHLIMAYIEHQDLHTHCLLLEDRALPGHSNRVHNSRRAHPAAPCNFLSRKTCSGLVSCLPGSIRVVAGRLKQGRQTLQILRPGDYKPGQVLGNKYEVLELLGRGGNAVTYKASPVLALWTEPHPGSSMDWQDCMPASVLGLPLVLVPMPGRQEALQSMQPTLDAGPPETPDGGLQTSFADFAVDVSDRCRHACQD